MRRALYIAAGIALAAAFALAINVPASAATICNIFLGCLGTSTAPAYGQVLIGGRNGEYEFVASSTLGSTAVGFSTTSAAYWLTQQSTSNLAEGSNLYFTNARAISALTGQSNTLFTNGAGYLTSLAGAASSTLLSDNNTFSGNLTLATTTAANINGQILVNGWPYAMNSTGIQEANDSCYISGCTQVLLANGTYDITNPINLSTSTVLIGQSEAGVILLQNPADISNIVFAMVQAKGFYAQNVTVENMTVDGNYDNLLSHPGGRGQLVSPASYWTIRNVTYQNANSFYTFPNGTQYVTYDNDTFQQTDVADSGSDIMGGGGNSHMLVENSTWNLGLTGNMFDNVDGTSNTFINNKFLAYNRGIYFEGMTNSTFNNNIAPSLAIESDAEYSPATITNATGTVAMGNTFTDFGDNVCVGIQYTSSTTAPYTKGGFNKITNNTCNYGAVGFLKDMNTDSADAGGDVISTNTCYDVNPLNRNSWNVGLGVLTPSCVNILQGHGMAVSDNTAVDDRALPFTKYVVSFGAGSTSVYPNFITAIGNVGTGMATGTTQIVSPSNSNAIYVFDGVSTTTSTNGFNISSGCYAINSNCIATSYWSSNGSNDIYNNNARYVGVGTSTPNSGLDADNYQGSAALHVGDIYQNSSITKLLVDNRWTGAGGFGLVVERNSSTPQFTVDGNGFVGIGTSTEGSILSVQGVANFVANATSTLYDGLNFTSGCVSVQGVCLTSNSGTVTSVATTWPITGGTFTTSGTIAFNGLSTTSPWTTAQLVQVSSTNQITSIATSSLGLTTSSFASPNISQWTNNSGYLTSNPTLTQVLTQGNNAGGLNINDAGTSTFSYLSATSTNGASAPAITVGGSTNTGIFSAGTNLLGLASGGSSLVWNGTTGAFYPGATGTKNLGQTTNVWNDLFVNNASTTLLSSTGNFWLNSSGYPQGIIGAADASPIANVEINSQSEGGYTAWGLKNGTNAGSLTLDTVDSPAGVSDPLLVDNQTGYSTCLEIAGGGYGCLDDYNTFASLFAVIGPAWSSSGGAVAGLVEI